VARVLFATSRNVLYALFLFHPPYSVSFKLRAKRHNKSINDNKQLVVSVKSTFLPKCYEQERSLERKQLRQS